MVVQKRKTSTDDQSAATKKAKSEVNGNGKSEAAEDIQEEKAEEMDTESKETEVKPEGPSLPLPEDIDSAPADSLTKVTQTLAKGKFAIRHYVTNINKALDVMKDIDPGKVSEEVKQAYETLKDFSTSLDSIKQLVLSDDTKKAFAFHVYIIRKGLPDMFAEGAAEKSAESDESVIKKMFSKVPYMSVEEAMEVAGNDKKVKEMKNTLLDEVKELNKNIEIMDGNLSRKLVSPADLQLWTFYLDNSAKFEEYYSKFGPAELITLSSCTAIGRGVLEKMQSCRKNWTAAGANLETKSPSPTSLVSGPLVSKDSLGDTLPCANTSSALELVKKIKKSLESSHASVLDLVKKSMSPEDLESLNFIQKDLEGLLHKEKRDLLPEEKIYLSYHITKIEAHTKKMGELNVSRKILLGDYVFRDSNYQKFGSPRGRGAASSPRGRSSFPNRGSSSFSPRGSSSFNNSRGGGSRGSSRGRSSFTSSRGSQRGSGGSWGRGGSGYSQGQGGSRRGFNHYGAY